MRGTTAVSLAALAAATSAAAPGPRTFRAGGLLEFTYPIASPSLQARLWRVVGWTKKVCSIRCCRRQIANMSCSHGLRSHF